MPFSWFCRLAQDQGICEICFPRKRWRHCLLSPTMLTCGHHKSIYSNILTRCMSEWCFSLLSWNLKVVSLHYCMTSQLRLCAPISTTKNTCLCYCVLCICDICILHLWIFQQAQFCDVRSTANAPLCAAISSGKAVIWWETSRPCAW